jgi:hypothetical protein
MGARLTILVLQSSCESHVTVEVGTDKFKARAAQVSGSERARLFDAAAKLLPLFADIKQDQAGNSRPHAAAHRLNSARMSGSH